MPEKEQCIAEVQSVFFAKCVPDFFIELKNSFSSECTFDYDPGDLCSNTLKVLNEKAMPCKCLIKNEHPETVREKNVAYADTPRKTL